MTGRPRTSAAKPIPQSSSRNYFYYALRFPFPAILFPTIRPERLYCASKNIPLSRRFHALFLRLAARGSCDSSRLGWRNGRQSTLGDHLHGALDWNVSDARFLVNPAITVELVFLIHQVLAQLDTLDDFEHRRAVVLEGLVHVGLGDDARRRLLQSGKRAGRRHLRAFVVIKKRIHADDDEINDDAANRETDHEGDDSARA